MAHLSAIFLLWEKNECSFDYPKGYCMAVDNILVLRHLQNLFLILCLVAVMREPVLFFLPALHFFQSSAFSFCRAFLYIWCCCIGKFENACLVIIFFFVSLVDVLFHFLSGVFFGLIYKRFLVNLIFAHQSLPAQFLLFSMLHSFFWLYLCFFYFRFLPTQSIHIPTPNNCFHFS